MNPGVSKITQICQKQNLLSFLSVIKNGYATEATFEISKPFKLHKLESGPDTTVTLTRDDALNMYTKLQTIRRMEAAAGNLYKEKIIRGFCHLYSGQEAVAVGIRAILEPDDKVITAYRCHAWTHLMGCDVKTILSELTGRKGGCARGKGGSMHMYTPNFYGGNGIVGAQVPLGAGLAFSLKYKNKKAFCLTLYGDGAANQGQVFEVYNMAKLWDLPVAYVCENNGYGMGTSAERAAASTDFYSRGDYIPGIWVDGMDVLAVRSAFAFIRDYITSGKGPLVVEAATYRYSGHSMSDPGTSYRTRDEVQEVRQTRDPITSFKEKILNAELVNSDELKKIDVSIKTEVDEAVKIAKADSEVGMDELAGDIYSAPLEDPIRGTTPFTNLKHKRVGPAVNFN